MYYQALNHHLVLMLERYLKENLSDPGYQILISPELKLDLRDQSSVIIKPALAVMHGDQPVMIADLDLQACGRQEYFTEKIKQYANSEIKEHWIFYTKDHIVVVRLREENELSKPVIFEEAELFRRGGLFPFFMKKG